MSTLDHTIRYAQEKPGLKKQLCLGHGCKETWFRTRHGPRLCERCRAVANGQIGRDRVDTTFGLYV